MPQVQTPPAPQTPPINEEPIEDFFAHPDDETSPGKIQEIVSGGDDKLAAQKISEALRKIKDVISDREAEGYDITELSELYRQCGNVFALDDFYTAAHYLERIQELLDSAPKIREGDEPGIQTGSEGSVQELEYELSDSDADVVVLDEPAASGDRWEIDDKPKMGEKEKAIHALEAAKTSITNADEDGYDTETAKNLFRQARPLYESKNFLAVVDKIREVEREILRIKGHSEHEIEELLGETADFEPEKDHPMSPEERNELNETVSKVWVMLREAERYKLDTSPYKTKLDNAKSRRSYSEARHIVTTVTKELKQTLSEYETEQHNLASNRFHQVRSEILGSEKLGIDVKPYNDMLDIASSAISRSNYEFAMITMDNCLKELAEAAASKTGTTQATTGATSPSSKSEPVWESDEDDETASTSTKGAGRKSAAVKNGLTDEKRLEILEDRFILGEVSETAYRELKEKLLKRMGR
jgi:hypothetical protein